MMTIPQLSEVMQAVMTTRADEQARRSGFVRRASKMTGARFIQTLVFGWLANPEATLEELSQTAAALGITISAQGIDERFSREAAEFGRQVLSGAVEQMVAADPVAIPILQRFTGVYLLDSSVIALPDALAEVWQGCGGRRPQDGQAAMKLQIRLDFNTGALSGPYLQAGREQDQSALLQSAPLPAGSLRITDLGYFNLDVFGKIGQQDGFWLSRLKANVSIYTEDGQPCDLINLLQACQAAEIDLPIQLGDTHRLPCRLLAARLPLKVAAQRRRKLKANARRKGQTVSQARLELADWTILVTNVPDDLLNLSEAILLYRVRWQIELLFKLWKSEAHLVTSRSHKPWRILTEIYAKLLAVLLQHWLLLLACWAFPDRSLTKAARTIRKQAFHLASSFNSPARLIEAIALIVRCLAAGCRINKRRKQPHTYQLLLALDDCGGLP